MIRLVDLKAAAQKHYIEPIEWCKDSPFFGGSAWADVDHHVVSVMVAPPPGNAQMVAIRGGKQEPLGEVSLAEQPLFGAYQMVMEL